jgi:hypothetical protein
MQLVMAILAISIGVLLAEDQATTKAPATPPAKTPATPNALPSSKSEASAAKPRVNRVLFITAVDSKRSDAELARLQKPGGEFEQMRGRGWKIGPGPENHLQVIDRAAVPDLVTRLEPREYPTVAYIEGDEIVRSFREGCTTPLDMWTFGWLSKGIDERPPGSMPEAARVETTGHYRLRGNHWTIDGDSNPSRSVVLVHLRGGFHNPQLSAEWAIDSWSYEELRSLHDDLHERYGGGVSHTSNYSRASNKGGSSFSASRKTTGR